VAADADPLGGEVALLAAAGGAGAAAAGACVAAAAVVAAAVVAVTVVVAEPPLDPLLEPPQAVTAVPRTAAAIVADANFRPLAITWCLLFVSPRRGLLW